MNETPSTTENHLTLEPPCRSIAIIGLGLLGGSVAMSIRRRWPDIRLTACARSGATRAYAIEHHIVDEVFEMPIAAADQCDLAVIATPVDRIIPIALEIASADSNITLTDVGSTKANIVRVLGDCDEGCQFVAAHPIAGGEKSGVQHSQADLFDGKPIIISPSGKETSHHMAAATAFWRSTGGRIVTMSATQHDATLARTSHLPHLLAALAARRIEPSMLDVIGAGWLGTTRVAAGDPGMWTAIVAENRDDILRSIDEAASDLNRLRELIQTPDDDALRSWLQTAQQIRESAD